MAREWIRNGWSPAAAAVAATALAAAAVALAATGCAAFDESGAKRACSSWEPRHVTPCEFAAPPGSFELSEAGLYTYDTETGRFTDPTGAEAPWPESVIIAQRDVEASVAIAGRIEISSRSALRVVGSRPLILVSWSDIRVAGTIDIASNATQVGAGSGTGCDADDAAEVGEASLYGAGGGGGGGFNGAGGAGGDGDLDEFGSAGGAGGQGGGDPTQVHGGCPGADGGGVGDDGAMGGAGGVGGGAIELVALDSIAVIGRVLAGGAGGEGGRLGGEGTGGGGGGSGGYIGLDAPAVTIGPVALLAANGGGGGEGADYDDTGGEGADAMPGAEPAPGGDLHANTGGKGGDGGARDLPSGQAPSQIGDGAGGGGGGGVGFVMVYADEFTVADTSVVSPQPTQR